MEHLSFNATPITPLPYFSEKYNVELLAKRDDLFSSALGGSKARMLQYILYPLLSGGGGKGYCNSRWTMLKFQ